MAETQKHLDSIAEANKEIELNPKNSQAYLKKGMACFALDEFETAKNAFEKGYELDPSNPSFKIWIRKCNAELEIEEEEEDQKKEISSTKVEQIPTNQSSSQTIQPSPSSTLPNTFPPTNPNNITSIEGVKIRHEWYQTNSHVIITVFAKNIPKEKTILELTEQHFLFMIKFSEENNYKLEMDLFSKIVPSECSTSYLSTKIEIKLKKENQSIRWTALEHTGEKLIPTISQEPKVSQMASKSKNWDKIAEEVAKGENLDELDGGDPLNKVFQNIYSNATDEQRRAMQKSFLESGGTVLSTNWDEVGKGKVQGSAPKGMEMHDWNEK